MTFIKIRISFEASDQGKAINADQASDVIAQVREDALFGTFSRLDESFWRSRMDKTPDELSRVRRTDFSKLSETSARCEFELELADDIFAAGHGGLQHLFGIIAGDLLQFTLPPIEIKNVEVHQIELTPALTTEHETIFRSKSNTIAAIRQAFKLEAGMPFLAFSFKPRIGFKLEDLEDVASGVLDEGFNLVELDTRYLAKDEGTINKLIAIAKKIAEKRRNHVARLSLNLSLPADLALDYANLLKAAIPEPIAFKIDGGFDGFSALQAVRRKLNYSPIVTCYPLFRTAFKKLVPSTTLVDALVLSGADIIYPGGRPDVGGMTRSIGSDEASTIEAVQRYRSFVENGYPMPSIAGGIYAGQLQTYYELLGPDVAWFLGGGVALHSEGPKAGARLCKKIAAESVEKRKRAGKDWADNIADKLVLECEAYGKTSKLPQSQLEYVSPKKIAEKFPRLQPIGASKW